MADAAASTKVNHGVHLDDVEQQVSGSKMKIFERRENRLQRLGWARRTSREASGTRCRKATSGVGAIGRKWVSGAPQRPTRREAAGRCAPDSVTRRGLRTPVGREQGGGHEGRARVQGSRRGAAALTYVGSPVVSESHLVRGLDPRGGKLLLLPRNAAMHS